MVVTAVLDREGVKLYAMKRKQRYHKIPYIFSLFLLFVCITTAVSVGSASLNPIESFKILLSAIPFVGQCVCVKGIKEVYFTIVLQVRLPRVLLSALAGGGLALVGTVFQGLFRNPLADPHILGVSSGAALGGTIAILFGIQTSFLGLGAIGCFAFLGAVLTVLFVYFLACTALGTETIGLLLTGTAVSTMLSAVISLLMTMKREGIEQVYYWTLGSFSGATWTKDAYLFLFLCLSSIVFLFYARELNLLTLGEETAQSLGIDIKKLRKRLILAASLLVAACVSVSGVIGFVGLIIPHCMRFLAGSDYRKLLPLSLLGGAVFLILCDTIARMITAPAELPVGVVTSLLGAPYFIFLLYRNKVTSQKG